MSGITINDMFGPIYMLQPTGEVENYKTPPLQGEISFYFCLVNRTI